MVVAQTSESKSRRGKDDQMAASIDSKKSKKKPITDKLSSNKSGPNTNLEEDDCSHWSQSKQKNQWQYEQSSKGETNEDDMHAFGSAINDVNFQNEPETDKLVVPTLCPPASAHKKVQQSFELDEN